MTVAEALQVLRHELGKEEVAFSLHDDCFVDFVEGREQTVRRQVMKPGRAVAAFVEQDKELSGIPFSGMYQHEYRMIDQDFPYQTKTLAELGIPEHDVLHVTTERADYYIETE